MASRATWRTVPGDPCSRLGWLVRDGRRRGILLLKRGLLGAAALGFYALSVGATAAFAASVAAFWALRRALPDATEGPEGAEPAPGDAFHGAVEIRRAGALLGEDEAVVTFVDGWLHVEGRRTAFALSHADLAEPKPGAIVVLLNGVCAGLTGRREPVRAEGDPLNRLTLGDGTELRFDLRPSRDVGKPGRCVLFARSLARWRGDAPALGESVLPPERPHPSAGVRAGADVAVAAVGTAVGFGIVASYGFWWGLLAFMMVPGPSFERAVVEAVRLRRLARRAL